MGTSSWSGPPGRVRPRRDPSALVGPCLRRMYQPPWSPMNNDLNQDFVVGLDAGGTRTRAVLASARDGRPRGEGAAGPGNALTVPVPQLTDHIAEAIAEAVPEGLRGQVAA